MPVFISLDYVGEVFSCMARCILDIGLAQGFTVVMSSRSALFLRRGWLSKSAPAPVVMLIHRRAYLPFCPRALSEGPCIFNKLDFALGKGSSECLVEHSIVGERASSRPCAGCSNVCFCVVMKLSITTQSGRVCVCVCMYVYSSRSAD